MQFNEREIRASLAGIMQTSFNLGQDEFGVSAFQNNVASPAVVSNVGPYTSFGVNLIGNVALGPTLILSSIKWLFYGSFSLTFRVSVYPTGAAGFEVRMGLFLLNNLGGALQPYDYLVYGTLSNTGPQSNMAIELNNQYLCTQPYISVNNPVANTSSMTVFAIVTFQGYLITF